ncbi:transcriptional regulator domain-containing protein [Rhodopseudomonas palustris]|uniref:Transcriptional regulator-like domain-containing protein n=1 Tax=Rhodopseudomonas palustris (strain BisB18) TaxID=316056 RepID=Q20ZJ8_RHOPB
MPNFDWRSPATYARAEALDHTGFAWECLRRNPDYRRDWQALGRPPDQALMIPFRSQWGLSFRR